MKLFRLRYRREAEKVLEEKRSTLVNLTQSLTLPHRYLAYTHFTTQVFSVVYSSFYHTGTTRSLTIANIP